MKCSTRLPLAMVTPFALAALFAVPALAQPTTGTLKRGGFTFPENTEKLLKGSTFIAQEGVGGGNLVMFTSEPMFRGWWRALDRLVLNAILLGPSF